MENQPSDAGELLWRRKLSDAERAALPLPPELAIEARLTDALRKIPDVAVPSNFTARVLEAVALEEAQAARLHARHWSWRSLLPRIAVAAAVLVFVGVGIQRHEAGLQRAALAKNIALVAAQPLPSVEALNNFDAIRRMSHPADDQLIALLQ
jgi:negative regulator of sigma E activity